VKFRFIFVGKTTERWLQEGIREYTQRLEHYGSVETVVVPASTHREPARQVEEEGLSVMKALGPRDWVVLLDERGDSFTSVGLAELLGKRSTAGVSSFAFVIGGAYGWSPAVREKAKLTLSLSELTFTHQMVRVILLEQVYRAMTILKGESYHHA
jgi:23S rRNA (pseudouridine1915-N3)-methyltransferase